MSKNFRLRTVQILYVLGDQDTYEDLVTAICSFLVSNPLRYPDFEYDAVEASYMDRLTNSTMKVAFNGMVKEFNTQ